MRDSSTEAETMRVILLLCSAFALSVTTADPVKQMKPEPVEDPLPVQQNKTADEKRGELLRRITGMGAIWLGNTPPPDYFPGENNCPPRWHSYRGRCFSFINIHMAWMEAESGEWLWSDGSAFNVGSWATLMPGIWNRWNKCLSMGLTDQRYCEEMFPFVCGTKPDLLLLM
ncbi:uncharacterized protein LOC111645580 isoform X3 [Seriola lalandi dorsalis]|uniref:uncharacterized protein LOC111645580 isoform X3 n=1 Tax=Seriola lalandi dorsalis TaxID=1841481 RepID=UPI000C6F766D|nr:uncharacterized protein LOC111645580 isoform X3 [Seriola lalandi dorsalis]